MDCCLQGSSVPGILQARILDWVTISFSRVSSWPRDQPRPPAPQADSLLSEPPGKLKYNVVEDGWQIQVLFFGISWNFFQLFSILRLNPWICRYKGLTVLSFFPNIKFLANMEKVFWSFNTNSAFTIFTTWICSYNTKTSDIFKQFCFLC